MSSQKHYIIRVGDGENLIKGEYPMYGLKKRWKPHINKIKKNDILWFLKNKKNGGCFMGIAKFTGYTDRDLDLRHEKTFSNEEHNWKGDEEWVIQIRFEDYRDITKTDIKAVIRCALTVMSYDTFKGKENFPNLVNEYNNFQKYQSTKIEKPTIYKKR